MKVNVSGYNELAAALMGVSREMHDEMRQAMQEACIEVEGKAKEKCPKDTNALRQSIGYKVEDEQAGATVRGYVGSDNEHAVYVHEGTGIHSRSGNGRKDVPWTYRDEKGQFHKTDGIEPTPFLEDARAECAPRISEIFAKRLGGLFGG